MRKMKRTICTRKVDELGRIVIPIEARYEFDIKQDGEVEISIDPDAGQIILQKSSPVCLKCRGKENLKQISSVFYLCSNCIENL